ncbi:hypothetical protein BT96DRAFT_957442 [Gymnopus androsaceus JB14]|uniref:Uncharacterized protein n=1 Tax=Gymnopus androsaceus JB14 TaxID=1447944 RepID=A0A6A4HL62_9AGAR|nr:hypothetical protein BT96DRAFT_957442 [Gymnopus androsaceus JB14]
MRRAQSVRLHSRTSLSTTANTGSAQLALNADDLGVLREGDESDADVLRKQLLEKDRECDRLKTNLSLLQSQLTLRPPVEHIQALEREYKDLELLLTRCMTEMERMKIREKMLERELARLAGDNWQMSLDIPPAAALTNTGTLAQALVPILVLLLTPLYPHPHPSLTAILTASPIQDEGATSTDPAALAAHIDKIRLLILGMETRLSKRETDLLRMVSRAEGEGKKWEDVARSGGGVRA